MAQFVKHFVQDLTQDIKVRQCGTIVFNADDNSNVITIDLFNGSEPATLGGSVVGAVICSDGSTVPVTGGTISGNTVSITLGADCFAIEGPIGVGVQIVNGTQKTTVLKAIYNVEQFTTDNVVDPGSRITITVSDLVSDIEAATAKIPASDMASLMAGIAPTFSASTSYAAGAYVYYSGTLYRFTAAHSGSWTGTDAVQVALSNDLGEQVKDLKSAFDANNTARYITSNNLFDMSEATVGYQINGVVGDTYTLYANSDRVVTHIIPCSLNDTFYITRLDGSDAFGNISSSNFVNAVAIDADGKILKRGDWVNGFTADTGTPVAVRFTITKSVYTNNKIINVTKNYYPTSKKGVAEYKNVKTIAHLPVNMHVVDMWGDSRIGNGWGERTDVANYLTTLLNQNIVSVPVYGIQYNAPQYMVHNYGINAQASGMVAARFGSNEVFVNLNGDKIPASGDVTVAVYRCTTGGMENLDCCSTNAENGILCEINGVVGYFMRSQDTIKFVRKEAGSADTPVRPLTKLIVPDVGSKHHVCIFQCGKNDMTLADGYEINGTIGNMCGMVEALGHDKFIILGETYDCDTTTYGTGKTLRGYVDQINAWYANKYPNNYIDIQAELITNGLTLEGITPTAQDEENISNGFIPDSLMQDATHPNSYGREAIAKIIYAWMQTKNWI